MNFYKKITCITMTAVLTVLLLCPSAFAKEFAPIINTSSVGVNTQYKYENPDPSWLRQLVIKEDMLSTNGLLNEEILYPVCDYPYTSDAKHFKAQVEEYIELYTLDDDSQKAAYLYLLEQIGALSIIANPETTEKSKADWLREQGIVITPEDEKDPDKILMISALYALMQNDFYYVIKGERLKIPAGTTLEEATVMYLMGLSGDSSQLTSFVLKFFGSASVGNLDDYVYYTSLMALYTQGYISPLEIPTIPREEVYRRLAIMTIRNAGIAIDAETATTEEIRNKYLVAMLGMQYSVTLSPTAFMTALNSGTAPFYILQRIAYEDSKVTISQTKHTYEECFDIVLKKTDRFDLENEFFSDIFEYDIHLDNIRSNISVNPNPINKTGVTISINGVNVTGGSYAVVELLGKAKETITIVCRQKTGNDTRTSIYKVNVHQGTPAPSDSDITGIIPTLGDILNQGQSGNPTLSVTIPTPGISEVASNLNSVAKPLLDKVLSLNDKGQLVDKQGNIVSDATYETLPNGYDYVINDDGIVSVVVSGQKATEPTTEDGSDKIDKQEATNIVIIAAIVCIILLSGGMIGVGIYAKKQRHMTPSEKAKARKAKKNRKNK